WLHWVAALVLPVASWLQTAELLPGGRVSSPAPFLAAAPAGNAIAAAIPQARAPSLNRCCMVIPLELRVLTDAGRRRAPGAARNHKPVSANRATRSEERTPAVSRGPRAWGKP